jgi:hypothetical protein
MMRASWRKLTTPSGIWLYRVGTTYVSFTDPNRTRWRALVAEVKGLTPDQVDRGRWKQTSDGMLTPSEVRAYIDAHWGQP